jgi:hypothetical protein
LRKRFFYSKTSRWKHENEYRLVRPLADCPEYVPPQKHASYRDNSLYLFDFSFDCIASVTFGAYMAVAKKRLIELCCEGQNIGFFQAVILRNSQGRDGLPGNINLVPIDEFGTRSRFYSMEPHHFCSDINEHVGASPKRIANLRELPYYEGHEKVVAETLRRLRLKENSGKEDS